MVNLIQATKFQFSDALVLQLKLLNATFEAAYPGFTVDINQEVVSEMRDDQGGSQWRVKLTSAQFPNADQYQLGTGNDLMVRPLGSTCEKIMLDFFESNYFNAHPKAQRDGAQNIGNPPLIQWANLPKGSGNPDESSS